MKLFERIEYGSGHGTSQGIYPRFYLQIQEIANYSGIEKEKRDKIFAEYHEKVFPDITHFYDIYHEIELEYKKYHDGLLDGTYFKRDAQGTYIHDRAKEFDLGNKFMDFFIKGRILLNNLSKSDIIKDDHFNIRQLLIVKDLNFEQNKNAQLEGDPLRRYTPMFEILENARKDFLQEFNQVRADIEHNNFKVNRFVVETNSDVITIIEPVLNDDLIINKIEFFYTNILRAIELLMVWFYGIKSYLQWQGVVTLFQRRKFDSKILHHEFFISPKYPQPGLEQLILP